MIYLVRSWPRLSQTFVLAEVLAQERLGTDLAIFSLARSGETVLHPRVRAVRAGVTYLDQRRKREWWARATDHLLVARSAPAAYVGTVLFAVGRPRLSTGYATCTTRRCLAHAVRLAAAVRRARRAGTPVRHVHAHFAHDPALVALLTSRLTGVPYSVTAHARDLYQIPPESLLARAARASAFVTCCEANADYLRQVLPPTDQGRLRVIHHGVELDRFRPVPAPAESDPVELLSVGRLVEKKGFPDLLRACALLRTDGHRFRLRVYGDGPLRERLEDLRDRHGLAGIVEFLGERAGDEIVRAFSRADIFALTPYVTADGDRDGVPNVLVEAMACGLPVVATRTGGVPEIVRDGHNGLLVKPRDVPGIAAALATLLTDPRRRRVMGRAARRTVEADYDVDVAARELVGVFAGDGRGAP